MNVGFDIDGVLYDWHTSALNWYNEYNNTNITYNDFWSNNQKYLPDNTVLSYNVVRILHLYTSSMINSSIMSGIKELDKHCTLYCVTGRSSELKNLTLNYFRKQNFPIPPERFVFCDSKEDVIDMLNLDYYVEDNVKYLEQVLTSINSKLVVGLVNKIYNKNFVTDDPRVIRFPTTECFINYVLEDICGRA